MQGYTRVMFAEICRLCATNRTGDKVNIFHEEGKKLKLQNKMESLVNIKVTADDNLPKVICATCLQKLEDVQTFWNVCQSSEIMLNNFYSRAQNIEYFKNTGSVYIQNSELNIENDEKKNYFVVGNNNNDTNVKPMSSPTQSSSSSTIQPKSTAKTKNPKLTQTEILQPPQQQLQAQIPTMTQPSNVQHLLTNTLQTINTKPLIIEVYPDSMDIPMESKFNTNVTTHSNTNAIDYNTIVMSHIPQMHVASQMNQNYVSYSALTNVEPTNIEITDAMTTSNDISQKPVKAFQCPQCNRTFKRREHLFQHSKLHTGLRPYKCSHCPKAFMRKEHLLRHDTSHTGQKDHTCDVCFKGFSRSDNLLKHRKTHEKEQTYMCDICPKMFVLKHYYDQHMESMHSNDEGVYEINALGTATREANDTTQIVKYLKIERGDNNQDGVLVGNNLTAIADC